MKTAIYIEDGIVQLVITPESDFEKNALKSFDGNKLEAKIFSGSFYDCRGGWTRQADFYPNNLRSDGDKSLILRMATKREGVMRDPSAHSCSSSAWPASSSQDAQR